MWLPTAFVGTRPGPARVRTALCQAEGRAEEAAVAPGPWCSRAGEGGKGGRSDNPVSANNFGVDSYTNQIAFLPVFCLWKGFLCTYIYLCIFAGTVASAAGALARNQQNCSGKGLLGLTWVTLGQNSCKQPQKI